MDEFYGFWLINHILAMSCMTLWILKQAVKGMLALIENALAARNESETKE